MLRLLFCAPTLLVHVIWGSHLDFRMTGWMACTHGKHATKKCWQFLSHFGGECCHFAATKNQTMNLYCGDLLCQIAQRLQRTIRRQQQPRSNMLYLWQWSNLNTAVAARVTEFSNANVCVFFQPNMFLRLPSVCHGFQCGNRNKASIVCEQNIGALWLNGCFKETHSRAIREQEEDITDQWLQQGWTQAFDNGGQENPIKMKPNCPKCQSNRKKSLVSQNYYTKLTIKGFFFIKRLNLRMKAEHSKYTIVPGGLSQVHLALGQRHRWLLDIIV